MRKNTVYPTLIHEIKGEKRGENLDFYTWKALMRYLSTLARWNQKPSGRTENEVISTVVPVETTWRAPHSHPVVTKSSHSIRCQLMRKHFPSPARVVPKKSVKISLRSRTLLWQLCRGFNWKSVVIARNQGELKLNEKWQKMPTLRWQSY